MEREEDVAVAEAVLEGCIRCHATSHIVCALLVVPMALKRTGAFETGVSMRAGCEEGVMARRKMETWIGFPLVQDAWLVGRVPTTPRYAENSGTQIGWMLLCIDAENRLGAGWRVLLPP